MTACCVLSFGALAGLGAWYVATKWYETLEGRDD